MTAWLKKNTFIRIFLFITPLGFFSMILNHYWDYSNKISELVFDKSNSSYLQDSDLNVINSYKEMASYTISTSGCKVPYMDTYNDVVNPLIHTVNITDIQKSCGNLPMLTFMTENNDIILIEESLTAFGVTSMSSFRCCVTEILRDKAGKDKDEYRYSKQTCSDVDLPYHVVQDYVRIQCFKNDALIYTDFYAAIQLKPSLEKQCANAEKLSRRKKGANNTQMSVVIVTLDSVSRLNFHRQMKKSSIFIKDTMKGIEMLGYNKLGDNTFPILVTILAGMSEKEVEASCSGPYDTCPFIWKNFSRNGYRTAYGEDSYIIASFNSIRQGFRQQPTDYYLRPLFAAEYRSVPRKDWNPHDYKCFASRVQVPVLFNWTRDFVHAMKDKLHFGYFHTSGLTHDDLNWAQLVDPMLFDLMHGAYHSGNFNNTVFILMSDHGMRFGPIRQTYFGKLEENLPLLIFVFPEWFRNAHSSAIRQLEGNSERLMSSFDIHETLADILKGDFIVRPEEYAPGYAPRGISLFQEIPEWRTCADALIPDHWCACQTVHHGDIGARKSVRAANAVITLINSFTEPKRNICALFHLKSLNRVDISKPTNNFGKTEFSTETEDYTVVIVTNPGEAEFEGTVRFIDENIVDVLEDVSRVNRYNNESLCITDIPHLKKYCYCLDN